MKSIRQTVQISNAQKLISASRIGRARRMLGQSAPYHDHIRQAIADLLAMHPEVLTRFIGRGTDAPEKQGLLVLSSDTGLAGGYNGNVLKFSERELAKQSVPHLIVQGNVGRNFFARLGIARDETHFSAVMPSLALAGQIASHIITLFEKREVDAFDVIYTRYDSAVRLTPVRERLFPLRPEAFGEAVSLRPDVTFEPSPESVMSMLIPKYLEGFLYGCLVHAWTSELASRVTAMDSAIRNGNEMLEKLSLAYNRARQAAITQEITEIVAGATAMTSDD
jgi:F-type H+-transporting ATPase subunit gamma